MRRSAIWHFLAFELDLDDGVKVNYRKLQTAQDGKFYEVLADSKNIMVKEKEIRGTGGVLQ